MATLPNSRASAAAWHPFPMYIGTDPPRRVRMPSNSESCFFIWKGNTMSICRTIIAGGAGWTRFAGGCLGSVCLLVGCGVVPGDVPMDIGIGADEFLSAGVDGFGGNHPLVVEADKATSQSTTVSLPGDLLEDAPDDAAIVLSAADITVTVNGELSGRKNLAAKAAEHHASITFHFGPHGKGACDSDDEVGPFELTIEDGVVTLAEESLPLDASVRWIVRSGEFEVCTETWANFDGSISLASVSFEFGQLRGNEQRVVLCHVPSGNPDNAHAITVGASAVDAHLAHGDYLGECEGRHPEPDSDGDPDAVGDPPGEAGGPDDNAEADGGDADDESTEADGPDDPDDVGDRPGEAGDDDEDGANDDEHGVTGGGGGAGGGGGGTPDPDGRRDDDDKGDRENVVICHIPPGNPDRRYTITVGEAALEAHLAHGDLLGECDEDEDAGGAGCTRCAGDVEEGDSDGDGVDDSDDHCSGTAEGAEADADGCSCSQKDTDSDGVNDCDDQCSGTADGSEVDTNGCSCSQKDTDGDGVNDCDDQCSGTAGGAEVDAQGCSCEQLGNCANECQSDGDCLDDVACTNRVCVEGHCVFQSTGHVRFVDSSAGGANDGSSWGDAYVDLQDALAEAAVNESITEIWVASAGGSPYTPAGGGGSRYDSFHLMNCLTIYGGFRGGEVSRDERDPKANVTILSGDLDGNDEPFGDIDENSYHVVRSGSHFRGVSQIADATAVLDGFTITGGNANGEYFQYYYGGGMYNLWGSPTVRNCVFLRNEAGFGGGMTHHNTLTARPTVSDCSFIENTAQHGGGIANSNGTPRLVRCQFVRNFAAVAGGGVYSSGVEENAPILTDCLLTQNSATTYGGAVCSWGAAQMLRNVTIASNTSGSFGGGLYVSLQGMVIPNSVVSNCVFWNNHDSSGETETSQIYSRESESNPLVSYTLIQGLDLYAAGAGNIGLDPLFVSDAGFAGLIPDTVGLRLREDSPAIDAGDPDAASAEGETDLGGHARVLCGRIDMGAYEFSKDGDADCDGVPDQDNRCQQDSDCDDGLFCNGREVCDFDAGCIGARAAGTTGAAGAPCDGLGLDCNEVIDRCVLAGHVRFVDSSAEGANDGSRWEDAYVDLQDALAEAKRNEGITEIWVASAGGSPYKPAGPGGGRSVSFELMNGLAIYGGFSGGEVSRTERDPQVNVTVLSGDLNGDDPDVHRDSGGASDNSYHVVVARYNIRLVGPWTDATAVLDGFTVTGGNANGTRPENYGGGMYNYGGSPTVRNCVFVRNTAVQGGGMANQETSHHSATVTDCSFVENVAEYGGGFANDKGAPRLARCQFVGNSAAYFGGGIFNSRVSDDTLTLTPTLTPTLTDCLLSRNSAGFNGGAIYNVGSAPTLRNVTIASNTAGMNGGGLYHFLKNPTISNCIFWKNSDQRGETEWSQIYVVDGNPLVSYTLIQGLDRYTAGAGNIDQDPLFVSDDNLRLQEDSPAIDAGDPDTVLEGGETDLDGENRILRDRVDMGAYEFSPP